MLAEEELAATNQTRIMLVDSHTIVREGLKEVLGRAGDFEVVGEAGDGATAVETAVSVRPDVVIMEITIPVKDGIEACREIRELLPDTQVLILTGSADEDSAIQSATAGATGYLQKFCSREKLLGTLRDVADGEFRLPATALKRVFANVRVRSPQVEAAELASLTAKERETLALFARGMTYAEIAQAKGIRPLTVRNSIYGIQNKLKVKSKQELVVRAVRSGLLDV
jgi:DNA-binding NarL/FixJ family response regulator